MTGKSVSGCNQGRVLTLFPPRPGIKDWKAELYEEDWPSKCFHLDLCVTDLTSSAILPDGNFEFVTHGAAYGGFHSVEAVSHLFSADDQFLWDSIKELLWPSSPMQVHFECRPPKPFGPKRVDGPAKEPPAKPQKKKGGKIVLKAGSDVPSRIAPSKPAPLPEDRPKSGFHIMLELLDHAEFNKIDRKSFDVGRISPTTDL